VAESFLDPRSKGRKSGNPVKAHIPLGLYILLRADIIHSGAMGSPGNVHFHMALKDQSINGRHLFTVTAADYPNFPSP
jgi:hypothetical protein